MNDSRRTAEVSGTSGKVRIDNERADGNNYLQSRPEKKWANLDKREKERISRSVNKWIDKSNNYDEIWEYILSLSGKTEDEITPRDYRNAIRTIAASVYDDAVNSFVIAENVNVNEKVSQTLMNF